MTEDQLYNLNVISRDLLPTPAEVKEKYPLSASAVMTVATGRNAIQDILNRKDPRLFMVVGPCSIHDLEAGREYASRLKKLADEVSETLVLIMRVYFEKPRTTVGWKGLINDPDIDGSFKIEKGFQLARAFLLELAELGLPASTEALDPITPQFVSDLITWTAIGARTTESQTHREMSSGLSTPVGFKNGTDGGFQSAINALCSVSQSHHFLGINQFGQCAVYNTRGNAYGHIVLRGGVLPNYDVSSIAECEVALKKASLAENIVVDCSHGNSKKDPAMQSTVLKDCVDQILNGNRSIVGFMLESYLEWGNQKIPKDLSQLRYGVSITDACIDWSTTEEILRATDEKLKGVLHKRL